MNRGESATASRKRSKNEAAFFLPLAKPSPQTLGHCDNPPPVITDEYIEATAGLRSASSAGMSLSDTAERPANRYESRLDCDTSLTQQHPPPRVPLSKAYRQSQIRCSPRRQTSNEHRGQKERRYRAPITALPQTIQSRETKRRTLEAVTAATKTGAETTVLRQSRFGSPSKRTSHSKCN